MAQPSFGRQIASFAMIGVGMAIGIGLIEAALGGRKVKVIDKYPDQQMSQSTNQPMYNQTQQPYQPYNQPINQSFNQSTNECSQAVTALYDCETRNGVGSQKCRFFRERVTACGVDPRPAQ